MCVTKNPADIVTEKEMEYLKDANERQTRQFAAIVAERIGIHGVAIVCYAFGVSRNTVYRGLHELQAKEHLDEGKVRKKGGGRKSTLSVHPEYINIFREIVEFDIAGLPQDANTKWLRLTPSQIHFFGWLSRGGEPLHHQANHQSGGIHPAQAGKDPAHGGLRAARRTVQEH